MAAVTFSIIGGLGLIGYCMPEQAAQASGTTTSQTYTVTLTDPTLGLTLTPPTTSAANDILPSGDSLTSTANYFNASGNAMTLTNTGNTSGTLATTLTATGGLTEVGVGTTPAANQYQAQMAYSSGTTSGSGYFDSSGNFAGTLPVAAGATATYTPTIEFGAGTGAGTYGFTFNFTIS